MKTLQNRLEIFDFVEDLFNPAIFTDLLWCDRGYKIEDFQDARAMMCQQEELVVDTSCPETGKTFQLATDIIYGCGLHKPQGTSLFLAPRRVHLNPVVDVIENRFNHNKIAKLLIKKIVRHPNIEITFNNDHIISCRIASTEGEAFIGKHPDYKVWVDEGESFPKKAFQEIFSRMKAGCKLYVCGMINGDRSSVLYAASHQKAGKFFVINIPRWKSGRMNLSQYKKVIRGMGGKGSQEAKNKVFSLWGDPISKLFPLSKIDKITRVDENYSDIIISESSVEKNQDIIETVRLPFMTGFEKIALVMDLGVKPDPSIFGLCGLYKGLWTLVQVIEINGIDITRQAKFIYDLFLHYGRRLWIAYDFGFYGNQVKEHLDIHGYPEKIAITVSFGSNMKFDEYSDDDDYDEKGNPMTLETFIDGIMRPVKFITTEHLLDMINEERLSLPPLSDTFDKEFQKAWQMKMPDGRIVYNKTNDHRITMLRCLARIDFDYRKGYFPYDSSDEDGDDSSIVIVSYV
jgi:hypothetical protein